MTIMISIYFLDIQLTDEDFLDIQLTDEDFREYNKSTIFLKLWIFRNLSIKKRDWVTNLQIKTCFKAKITISKLSS